MQPCIPVSAKREWVASPQTLVSLSILIKIGWRFKAAFCPPRKHHNLALPNSEEEANACPTSVSVRSTSAHTLTIQFSLATVGVGADDSSTHKAHAGCFALLPNGPWTCERRYGVDQVGVVLRKRYQLGDLSGVAIVLSQSEVGMGHPATNKDECERGIEEKPWRGREAEILGEVSKLLVRRKNLGQFRRCTHTTEVVVEECCRPQEAQKCHHHLLPQGNRIEVKHSRISFDHLQEIKEGATVTSRGCSEVLPWLFREGGEGGKQLGHVSKKSKPEDVLVLYIARRQWGRALSIEQAWQGVGERDEEGEDIDFHQGRVHGLCLHQR